MDTLDLSSVADRLATWAMDEYHPTARVRDVMPMPGNSGYSFGFTLEYAGGAERLVIRMPHPRAQRQGNADVLRQVRVLQAAESAGVPVPAVRSYADDNPWFEVPYYVVSWVEGESTHLFDPDKAHLRDGSGLEKVFADGLQVLARIHTVEWQQVLADWQPRTLVDEIGAWVPTLRKSSNAAWVDLGLEVHDALLASCPQTHELGLVHGDYYSNNWLFVDDTIAAIIDWEIASIGAPGLDVGWICMIYDPESWGALRHRWQRWTPEPAWIVAQYEAASGCPVRDIEWYRALAGYRMGCIAARAYDLHRSGKRPDPAWDIVGESFPRMMARARELAS